MSRAGPIPSGTSTELDRLRQTVAAYFPVYETRVAPQSVLFAVHVDPKTLAPKFDALRRELGPLGYVPVLRRETGEEFVEVLRRPKLGPRRLWINFVLLAATIGTTIFAGAMIWLTYVGQNALAPSDFLYGAMYFAAPLMAIVGIHETAHFVVARRSHLDASLPYFIPVPPPYILGTFGAFVSIREPFPDRKTLFDVGIAGPLAGFALAVPIAFLGLSLSVHAPTIPANYCGPSILGQSYGNLLIGPSLIWAGLADFFPSSLISLHPLALAGWVGILVTAINLLPAGQLDGGHVFRALFGERARFVSYLAAGTLFVLGLFYIGWFIFAFFVFIIGLRHPPPLNDSTRLDGKRVAVGAIAAAILVGGFVLIPVSAPTGALGLAQENAVQAPSAPGTILANLSVSVTNQDSITHGLLYGYSITNVSVLENSTVTYLTGKRLADWLANGTWTLWLPNGSNVTFPGAASATLAETDYLSLTGGSSLAARAQFSDRETADTVTFAFSASELCQGSGGGSASYAFSALPFG